MSKSRKIPPVSIRSSAAEYSVIKKYLITASDGKLPENSTIRNFQIVQTEGPRQLLRKT